MPKPLVPVRLHSSTPVRSSRGWAATVAAWRAQLERRSGSTRTAEEYVRLVERFRQAVPAVLEAGSDACHGFAYAPGPSGRPPSASTVIVRLAALRSFFDFARRVMKAIAVNPADDVERPRKTRPSPRGLDAAAVRALLAELRSTRDRALALAFYLTGLRRTELLGLRAQDLERDGDAVVYRVRVKGGETRRRELPAPVLEALARMLREERRPVLEALQPGEHIFAVTAGGFAVNLRRAAVRAGLGRVSVHTLRHAAAKARLRTGAKVEEIQGFLGHKDLKTTSVYLAALEAQADPGWRPVAAELGL